MALPGRARKPLKYSKPAVKIILYQLYRCLPSLAKSPALTPKGRKGKFVLEFGDREASRSESEGGDRGEAIFPLCFGIPVARKRFFGLFAIRVTSCFIME